MHRKRPIIQPLPPKQIINKSSDMRRQSSYSFEAIVCNTSSVWLTWPKHTPSVVPQWLAHPHNVGPVYVDPLRNYSLQYAFIGHRFDHPLIDDAHRIVEELRRVGGNLSRSGVRWRDYYPPPLPGQHKGFRLLG